MNARDTALKEALQEFFSEEGDMVQLDHLVEEAINSLPISGLGVTHAAQGVLRKAFNTTTIGVLRHKSYTELVNVPGMSRGVALVALEALAPFERNHHDRPAGCVQPDTETA